MFCFVLLCCQIDVNVLTGDGRNHDHFLIEFINCSLLLWDGKTRGTVLKTNPKQFIQSRLAGFWLSNPLWWRTKSKSRTLCLCSNTFGKGLVEMLNIYFGLNVDIYSRSTGKYHNHNFSHVISPRRHCGPKWFFCRLYNFEALPFLAPWYLPGAVYVRVYTWCRV